MRRTLLQFVLVLSACSPTVGEIVPDTISVADSSVVLSYLPSESRAVAIANETPTLSLSGFSQEVLEQVHVSASDVRPYESFTGEAEFVQATAVWHAACLQDAGFPAEVTEYGTVSVKGPAADNMSTSTEVAVCHAKIVLIFPHPPPPVTEEEFQDAYDKQLEIASCLEGEGYSGEIPSFQVYFDSRGVWTAYDAVGDPRPEEWDRINVVCPQF